MKRQSTKLIVNAGSMFGRTIGKVVLALFTTRLVVQELGQVDYGLFSLVGVTVGFSAILSDGLQAAGQQHLAHELGSSGEATIARTYNTLWGIYTGVSLLFVLLGFALALPLAHGLNVPEDRVTAVAWTVVLSGITLAFTTGRGPHLSLLAAYQQQYVIAIIESISSVVRLGAAIALSFLPGDKLINWGLLLLAAALLAYAMMVVSVRRIPVARFNPRLFDRSRVKELTSFGVWSILGSMTWKLRLMVGQVILLQHFTPQTNGSLALSRQISTYQTTLAQPINKVFSPAITYHHGGERAGMVQKLVSASMRYDILIAALVAIPLIVDPYPLFELWLGTETAAGFPEITGLTRFLAISVLVSVVGRSAYSTVAATGKIRNIVLMRVALSVATLIAAAVHIAFFDGPAAALAHWSVVSSVLISAGNFWFMQHQAGVPYGLLLRDLAVRVAPVLAAGFGAAYAVVFAMDATPIRPVVGGAVGAAVMGALAWPVLFQAAERERILNLARQAARRVTGRAGRKNQPPKPPASPQTGRTPETMDGDDV